MDLILVFTIAFLITLILTPLAIKLAKSYGLVDDPRRRPHPAHVQQRIIPRAGGLPIYGAILLSSLLFLPIEKHLIGIFLGITILLIVGLIDDRKKSFSPYLRLLLLFLTAAVAVFSGIGISFVTNPLSKLPFVPTELAGAIIYLDQIRLPIILFGTHQLVLFADIFAFFWIVTLTQIVNWSKGVDGQMPGITLITALTLAFLSLKFYSQGDLQQLNIAKLSFILAGASLGSLIFNWYPAKILPGFSGSTISAYMIAVLAILSGAKVATALLVLAVPTIDFLYTISRRLAQGKSPVWGDRGHLHHRLLDLGLSHQQISLFYILVSVMLGGVSLLLDTNGKLFTISLVAAIFLIFILWVNSFGGWSKQPDQDNG